MVNKMQELLNKVNQSDMNDINLYLFSKPRKREKILFSFDRKLKKLNSPLLQLEQKMDCICYLDNDNELHNQTMYIFDKYNFELIFGFERKFKKEINEMLKKLEENESYDVNLLNLQQLYYKVENNKNHLKKLYVILKNDSFRYLTNENIEKIENKSNIKFNRPTGKLELETNDDVKKILNFWICRNPSGFM